MDELKKYVQKTSKDKLVLLIFAVVFAGAGYVLYTRQSYVLCTVMFLCALALFIGALTSSSVDKKFFEGIEKSSQRFIIVQDFSIAKSYANDNIRMGEKYIFCKKMAELVCYKDVKSLQYFENNDFETQRTEPGIVVALSNGKSRTLCNLYGNDAKMQAEKIFEIVLSKNPDVIIKN